MIRGARPGAAAHQETGETAPSADMPPAATPHLPEFVAEREQAFRERRAAAAGRGEGRSEAESRGETERFCTDAQHELAALRGGQRMVRFNARGTRVLDDRARAEQAEALERKIAEHCR